MMNKFLMFICIFLIFIGVFLINVFGNVGLPPWAFWIILMGLLLFLGGCMKGWDKKEWRKNIIGIVVIISIFGLGAILFLAIPTFTGFFIVCGFVLIAIGIVVRKFWPHRRGSVGIWFFSFSTSESLSLIVYGIFLLALGMFLAWLFAA